MALTVSKWNIIILGLGFLFVFAAFQTSSMLEESILDAAKKTSNGTFHGSGYISLAVIYASFSLSNWVAPFIVVLIGPRLSMFVSSCIYTLFIASFLKPMDVTLYTGSVLIGIAAAILWTAQGNFLSLNSNPDTISQNSAIFWALFQSSLLFGNVYQYFAFRGEVVIHDSLRINVYIVLTCCGIFGCLLLLLLRKPIIASQIQIQSEDADTLDSSALLEPGTSTPPNSEAAQTPWEAFMRSFSLFSSNKMLLLMIIFAYTGFELTFFSGVYGTCLGHTLSFGDQAKSYIGLSGILIGLGEIVGGVSVGFLGKKYLSRSSIVVVGFFVHIICFFLTFLNLPSDSTNVDSSKVAYITPSPIVAMIVAFGLGFGDSAFNTQVMSLLGDIYAGNDSPSAFALFKFMQALAAAGAFFYSTYLLLQWQLLILVSMCILGTLTYNIVETKVARNL